jgi:hypothetical protein
MTIAISGTTGITLDGQFNSASSMGFKNRLINSAMVIDQRNAGASVNITTASFVVDRFSCGIGYSTGHTGQKSTNAPPNYSNSILITVGTGASPSASQIGRIVQGVEGFNVADLGWGTATAATITLSFWVKSSLTGTFAGGVYNASANRTYVFTYAISSANTWEQKTVTIVGDTSGTWATDNTAGMYVNWDLGTGSTYQGTANTWAAGAAWATSTSVKLAATSGATFYITGVQLEKGSTATSFDYRPYGTELALCQRYYEKSYAQGTVPGTGSTSGNGGGIVSTTLAGSTVGNTGFLPLSIPFKVTKRTSPTLVSYDFDGTANAVRVYPADAKKTGVTAFANLVDTGGFQFMSFDASSATSLTSFTNGIMFSWTASAEL